MLICHINILHISTRLDSVAILVSLNDRAGLVTREEDATEAQEAHEDQDQDPVQQVSRVTQREQVPRHSVIILVFIQQTLVLASLRHVHGSRSCDSARAAASHVISSSMSEKNRRGGKTIIKRRKQPTGYRTSLTIIFKTYFKNKV